MRLDWTTAFLLVLMSLGGVRPARAQDATVSRPFILTFDSGICLPISGHFFGGYVTSPLALAYVGVSSHLDLSTHVGVGAFAALTPALGGVVGGSARLTQPWSDHAVRLTAGVGPAYASSGSILVAGDVSLEVRSRGGGAFVFGPALAVAVNRVGDGHCGVDTCDVYIPPGAYVWLIRLGLGFNL